MSLQHPESPGTGEAAAPPQMEPGVYVHEPAPAGEWFQFAGAQDVVDAVDSWLRQSEESEEIEAADQ